jgi:hypothetical protein
MSSAGWIGNAGAPALIRLGLQPSTHPICATLGLDERDVHKRQQVVPQFAEASLAIFCCNDHNSTRAQIGRRYLIISRFDLQFILTQIYCAFSNFYFDV